MIFDQTTIRGTAALLIGLVCEGRVLPAAFTWFVHDYGERSKNIIEHALIVTVAACFPVESRPVLIMEAHGLKPFPRFPGLPRTTTRALPRDKEASRRSRDLSRTGY